jgi:hypothetical protein
MPIHKVTLVSVIGRYTLVTTYKSWKERTLEDTDGGREVVNTAGGLESGREDLNGGNEIVGEAVVQVALFVKRSISHTSNRYRYRIT